MNSIVVFTVMFVTLLASSIAAPSYQEIITEYHTNNEYPAIERVVGPIGPYGGSGIAARPFYYNPQPQELAYYAAPRHADDDDEHRVRRQILGGGGGMAGAGASAGASATGMGGGLGFGGFPMMGGMFPFMG